jgi:hypothetical protein
MRLKSRIYAGFQLVDNFVGITGCRVEAAMVGEVDFRANSQYALLKAVIYKQNSADTQWK